MALESINRDIPCEVDVTFFVPCYNEQGNIIPTLNTIKLACQNFSFTYEVIVVDDNSIDRTLQEVGEFQSANPSMRIRSIANKKNRGLARNYVDGAYLGRGRYYMAVFGDNSEPPETLRAILEPMGKADIIIPVFRENDSRRFGRRMLSRIFVAIVNVLSGNNIGYYNGPALHRRFNVMRWHADTDGFGYQAEIITRLVLEGATYKEVFVANKDREIGSATAISFKNFLAVGHSLLQIALRRLRYMLFYRANKIS